MFRHIDRIYELDFEQGVIKGLRLVTRTDPYLYRYGERLFLNPFIICEALMQLGACYFIKLYDFKKRPLLLAADHVSFQGLAFHGDVIDCHVALQNIDDEVVVFNAVAHVDNKVVISAQAARGYLVDMDDFDDPEVWRKQFNQMYRPGQFVQAVPKDKVTCLPLVPISNHIYAPGEAPQFCPQLIAEEDGVFKVATQYTAQGLVSQNAPYFRGHFPRRPVMPGVIQLTYIYELIALLNQQHGYWLPYQLQRCRFRHMIEPGDVLTVRATLMQEKNEVSYYRAELWADDRKALTTQIAMVSALSHDFAAILKK